MKLAPFAAAAIRLLILTGARLREILDAKWEQIDFDRDIPLFTRQQNWTKASVYKLCGEGYSERTASC